MVQRSTSLSQKKPTESIAPRAQKNTALPFRNSLIVIQYRLSSSTVWSGDLKSKASPANHEIIVLLILRNSTLLHPTLWRQA